MCMFVQSTLAWYPYLPSSFQSWFDFDSAHEDEVKERIIAQEREQHVLTMLHQVRPADLLPLPTLTGLAGPCRSSLPSSYGD